LRRCLKPCWYEHGYLTEAVIGHQGYSIGAPEFDAALAQHGVDFGDLSKWVLTRPSSAGVQGRLTGMRSGV